MRRAGEPGAQDLVFEHDDSDIAEAERGASREARDAEDARAALPGVSSAWAALQREWAAGKTQEELDAQNDRWARESREAQAAADAFYEAEGYVRDFHGVWRLP